MLLTPQVSAPPLIWMNITHASSQGHQRPNLDTVSYSMLGVDSDGERENRGPWDGDCALTDKGEVDRSKLAFKMAMRLHAISPTLPLTMRRTMFIGSLYPYSPSRMLVGAPWDGPSGDRRGDVYRCSIGGFHSAPCTKGRLGKEKPDLSPANS